VDRLKEVAKEGERIERESQKFIKMIARKEEVNEQMLDEVERYLSRDNLSDVKKVSKLICRLNKREKTCQLGWTNLFNKSVKCQCAPL